MKEDIINNPNHYHKGGLDVIGFSEMKFNPEELKGFYRINALKYITRYDLKNGKEDLEKAKFYLDKLIGLETNTIKVQTSEDLMLYVLDDVKKERTRQIEKWGFQRHTDGDWLKILIEEVGEVAQAMQHGMGWDKDTDASNLYEELIHVAAVAVSMAEQIKKESTV